MGRKQDLVYKIARRWISGKEMDEAIEAAKEVNAKHIGVILNYLGEDITDLEEAEKHAQEYLRLQRAIADNKVDGCVSVKLTQFGLAVDEQLATAKMELLAREAEALDQSLWIDMESSSATERTLRIYLDLLGAHPDIGIALQSYLRRSEQDLARLIKKGGRVRLVKGAYKEPSELAYSSREDIRRNFSKLMRTLFESGNDFAVATHDSILVEEAKELAKSHKVAFEFEMLRGIRDELKEDLVREGYRVVDYLPYGDQWYAYSMRRVKEHPSNIWLLLRSLL